MKDYKKYFRTLEKVEEDLLLPFLGLGEQPGTELRMAAIIEVLRRIPEEDYEILKRKKINDDFQWFIPPKDFLAHIYPFTANVFNEKMGELEVIPYAKVIFLNPLMEEVDFDVAIASIAHELAHIVLGHQIRVDSETYKSQEEQAWKKVVEWGFVKEEKKHRKFYSRLKLKDSQ